MCTMSKEVNNLNNSKTLIALFVDACLAKAMESASFDLQFVFSVERGIN